MTPERLAHLQEIFEAVIDLNEPQRTAYLDRVCASDSGLRDQLNQLLAADQETMLITEPVSTAPGTGVMECSKCWRCYPGPQSACPHDGATLQFAFTGPQLIDEKYLVVRRIGRGGMGAVYLAQHVGLEKRFALKLMLSEAMVSPQHRESFENEARALGRLNHSNIVNVTDYGIDPRGGGLPYLVMEYLEGKPLSEVVREQGNLPPEEAIGLLRVTADAIDAAHKNNIVHGDLKPSNLFLAEAANASPPCLKVVDFGLARLAHPDNDGRKLDPGIRGTPAYMAPELLRGEEATAASDRFALGALAYELLTGRVPFGHGLADVVTNVQKQPSAPSSLNPALPVEIDASLVALLSPTPADRPPSASAAIAAIAHAWLNADQRKWRAREWPKRLIFSAAVTSFAILVSAGLAQLRMPRAIEGRIADLRFPLIPATAPHSTLTAVSIDDATLDQDQRPLPERADEFAATIERIFASGAKAVALDIMLPFRWSESQAFAKTVISHADRMTLAVFSSPAGKIVGTECLSQLTGYLLGPDRYTALFGLVNLEEDEDGIIRHAWLSFKDKLGQSRPSFALRAVQGAFPERRLTAPASMWIDYSASLNQLSSLSWKDVPSRLSSSPYFFRGRLVFIGTTFAGNGDEHRVPAIASDKSVPGEFVQALIANTILEENPIREVRSLPCLAGVSLACFAATAASLCFPHRYVATLTCSVFLICAYAGFAGWIFHANRTMIPVVGPELAILLSMLAAWGLKARLSAYPGKEP